MGLMTVKRKLIAELPIPLNPEVTEEFLSGLDRGGINQKAEWDSKNHRYIEKFEDDYIKYHADARVVSTKFAELGNVLVVDIYNLDLLTILNSALQYRLLITQSEFLTLEYYRSGDKIAERYRDSMIDKLLKYVSLYGIIYSYSSCDTSRVMIGEEQARLIKEYLYSNASDALEAIFKRQEQIRKQQLEAKYKRIRDKVDMELAVVPPSLSQKTLVGWAENHVFLEDRYIVYRRVGKKIVGYCSHCHADIKLKAARHGEMGVCPNCKSRVVLKSHGRTEKTCSINKKLAVLQKCGEGFIIRHYFMTKRFYDMYAHNDMYIEEKVRTICGNGKTQSYYYDWFRNTNEIRWCNAYRERSEFGNLESYVYTPTLKKVLKGTPYQYCALYEYAKTENAIDVGRYLERYLQHPQIEYLVKLKLYRLAKALVNYGYSANDLQGNSVADVLGVGKRYIPMLQELDVSLDELKVIRAAVDAGMPISNEDILFLRKHVDGYGIGKAAKIACRVRLSAALPYCLSVAQQKCEQAKNENRNYGCHLGYRNGYGTPDDHLRDVLSDYNDYTRECMDLELDLREKLIAYPRDFYEAHARTSAQVQARTNVLEKKKIAKVAKKYGKYNMTVGELMISVAKTAEEIIYEGKKLSHCVGGYVHYVADEHSIIFFLRKTNEPDTPYYTVELDPDKMRIVQYRGYKNNRANNPVPKEIHEFIGAWKKHIMRVNAKKNLKQETIIQTVAI